MLHNNISVKEVAEGLSNIRYAENLQATKELMELFDKITEKPLNSAEDYIKMYDDSFYTYPTFEELVESEKEQSDGLTEDECKNEIKRSIWMLPCGWYVQRV